MAFATNVFVNCPFEEEFYPLLRPLLFTIIFLGLTKSPDDIDRLPVPELIEHVEASAGKTDVRTR